ncbi:MAG: hypothetical protein Q9M82_00975 [Mariprofundus sp.]|nr:hypothetical protein [Mariprofundus sp.]
MICDSKYEIIELSFNRYDGKLDGGISRIALHTWQANDSWEKLALHNQHMLGRFTADKLAALNGMLNSYAVRSLLRPGSCWQNPAERTENTL